MSSAQTSNHPLGAVKEFGVLCLFNDAWSQKGHSASTRQLYLHQAVKEVGVFYFIIFYFFWGDGGDCDRYTYSESIYRWTCIFN